MANTQQHDTESEDLQGKLEFLKLEYQICRRKLDSKCEALIILSRELDQCRSERDQFKLMAEQVQERYKTIKKHLDEVDGQDISFARFYAEGHTAPQNVGMLLSECREQNKSLKFSLEDMKQKFRDAQGDIKLLREQIARQRVGATDEGINTRNFPAHEREDLVRQLEESKEQYEQLERDLQQVLDEREEHITERDAYKHKYERLNQELNYILKGDEKRILDIDALVNENKYLQDRLKQMEEEKYMAMATVSKYKSLLEKKKNKSSVRLGQSRSSGLVITQKQVQHMLEDGSGISPSPQAVADLQAVAHALLETVNDKNLALSHQRKTNKILGSRVSELEKKIKTLEVSGLWNIPAQLSNLGKLRAECEEVKMLIPDKVSESGDTVSREDAASVDDFESDLCSPSPTSSSLASPVHNGSDKLSPDVPSNTVSSAMDDLDLLPSKEEPVKLAKNTAESEEPEKCIERGIDRTQSVTETDDLSEQLTSLIENSARKITRFSKRSRSLDTDVKQVLPTVEESDMGKIKISECTSSSPESSPIGCSQPLLSENADGSSSKDDTDLHDVSV